MYMTGTYIINGLGLDIISIHLCVTYLDHKVCYGTEIAAKKFCLQEPET